MKKLCAVLVLLLALSFVPALADSYAFAGIYMSINVPNDPYLVQLTPENLAQNEQYILSLGETPESMQKQFSEEGILLMAFDDKNSRTFVITAVQDDVSRELFDINEQTAATRATYRANHSNIWGISLRAANGKTSATTRGVS